jgi:hypothetical protein
MQPTHTSSSLPRSALSDTSFYSYFSFMSGSSTCTSCAKELAQKEQLYTRFKYFFDP